MAITRVYLGNPLSPFGIQALPAIPIGQPIGGNAGMSPSFSRGTAAQSLLSGGVATLRKPNVKSAYPIVWNIRGPADVDLLMSFFDGGQGGGPYCFLDPSQSNYLPANVARMGAVLGSVPEWSPTAGVLAPSTATPPVGLLTGVASWTSAVTGSILYEGLNNVVDGTWLPPVVPGLAHRMGIFAKLVSGTGSLQASIMYGIGGSAPAGTAVSGPTVALNTSTWQEVNAGVANTFSWAATADYAMMKLTVSAATTPVILLAAASMVYEVNTNASALAPWVSGIGVPRVVISGDAASPVGRPTMRDFQMTLAEA